jgi:Papain family cysteine protease
LENAVDWNADSQMDFGFHKGLTWFADYTQREYTSQVLCSFSASNQTVNSPEFAQNRIPLSPSGPSGVASQNSTSPPASVDWREAGVVGLVKNQQDCGSCWAHGPVAAVESAFALLPPISGPPDLSVQELIDCTPGSLNDNGCNGNNEFNAYNTIITRRGISLRQSYPYVSGNTSVDGACRPTAETQGLPFVTIDGFVYDTSVDEEIIREWVAHQPVTVSVDATEWKDYRGGIFNGPCSDTAVNHVVVIVGYGDEAGTPYWIIRNSWGPTWGEQGYMRLRRNASGNGRCGISSELSFPLYCGWNAICRNVTDQGKQTSIFKSTGTVDATGLIPIEPVLPRLQPGLPLPVGYRGVALEEKSKGPPGEMVVEYGEYETSILADFDKKYGAYMQE